MTEFYAQLCDRLTDSSDLQSRIENVPIFARKVRG
jgi:hypothetical protein